MKKVLIIVTNHATLGETDQANGTYAPELTHALSELLDAGFDYDLASIKGGQAPLYGTDIEGDAVNAKILADDDFQNRVNNTIPVSQINGDHYDAIFYPLISRQSTMKMAVLSQQFVMARVPYYQLR